MLVYNYTGMADEENSRPVYSVTSTTLRFITATLYTGRTGPCGRRAVLWCANGSKWYTKLPSTMTRGVPLKPPRCYARQCKALLLSAGTCSEIRTRTSPVGSDVTSPFPDVYKCISGSPPIPPVRMEGETK